MAELAIEVKNLLLERIIMTIKRYGETVSDGYKIDFAVFAAQLPKDEILSSSQKLSMIQVTESNIFGFFKGREDMRVQLISEGKKHCLYLKPRGAVSSKEIKEEAKTVINQLLKEQKPLSYKKVYEELSGRIVFFEYQLRRKNEPVKEYIQQLFPSSVMKSEKQGIASSGETVTESSDKTDDERLVSTIARIIDTQGDKHNGVSRIPMGELCVKLTENRLVLLEIRKKGKGTIRDWLADCCGKSLEIRTIDGIEWVSLPQITSDGKTDSETEKKSNEPELSAEEAVKRVRKEILSILEQQGTVSGGYRQMVLGMLCNVLANSSVAYQKARNSYHGSARSFLLDRFGDLLTIEYLDGKDWARVPLAAFGAKKEKAKVELPKGKPVPEVKPVPMVESSPAEAPSVLTEESVSPAKEIKTTKTTKTVTKKKVAVTELLIHELSDLSDEELEQLLLVVRLIHETSGNDSVKTTKKKTEYAANKNETSSTVAAIAAKIGINAQAVLAKNETMNKITSHLTSGEIIEIILEEIKLRKGVSGELSGTGVDKKAIDEAKASSEYKPVIMTDTDYEGLDDWLPF